MSQSHGRAITQNFQEFAQNLENCMRKLKIYSFSPLFFIFFLQNSHILCDFRCDFVLLLAQKFQN